MTAGEARTFNILMVDDNPGDVRLTQETLGEGPGGSTLHVTTSGRETLAFLRREGQYADAARPDLILLDINLPDMNGRELLREIKEDDALRRIPVAVFTSSTAASDVRSCYELHANCFVKKPLDFEGFARAVRLIEEFWLSVSWLPSRQ